MSMTFKPDPPLKVVSAELAPIRTRPRAESDMMHHYEDLGLGQVRAVDAEFAANKPNAVPLLVEPPPVGDCWEHFASPADFTMEKACAYDAMYSMLLTVERSYERLGVAADSLPQRPSKTPVSTLGTIKCQHQSH
ncbi:hypothetical protein PRIC2_001798 [Phytophthora ramorum]